MNPRSALVADRVAADSTVLATSAVNPPSNGSSTPNGTDTHMTVAATRVAPVVPRAPAHAGPVTAAPVVPPATPERLAARRTIDQAKLLLIARQNMSEPEAYRWIQKTAMNRRVTMGSVAAAIISGLDAPDASVATTDAASAGDEPAAATG